MMRVAYCAKSHDPAPDASVPPTNKAIIPSGARIGQRTPGAVNLRHCAQLVRLRLGLFEPYTFILGQSIGSRAMFCKCNRLAFTNHRSHLGRP